MYIDPHPRRRKRSPLPILLLTVILLLVGGYYANEQFDLIRNPFQTPTPTPTPTRTTLAYLADAQVLYEEGKTLEAVEAYQVVAKREPENDEVRRELARLLIYNSEFEEALRYAREAEQINPDDGRNLAALAWALDWTANYDEALSVAQLAVELAPELAETHAALAEVLADVGSWYEAVAEAQTAVEIDERSVDVQRVLGYTFEVQGKYGEAITHYEQALALQPNLPFLYLTLGTNYRALATNQWGTQAGVENFARAVEIFRQGLEIDPENATLRFNLGKTLFQAGDQELGIHELRKAVELRPDMPEAYQQLGVNLYLRRAYEEAIENMLRAVELGDESSLNYYILGRSYLNLEEADCDNAVPWLEQALQLEPDQIPAADAAEGLRGCGVTPP